MNCPACGEAILSGARFCNNCGTRLNAEEEASPSPDGGTVLDRETVPYLLITAGAGRGQVFELRGDVHLGRSRANPIALVDSKVSRNHARLDPMRNTYILTDLGSANGTYVNGVRITQPVRLRDGDLLQLGDTQLVFHVRPPAFPQTAEHPGDYPSPALSASPGPIGKPGAPASYFSLPFSSQERLPSWVWAGCIGLLILVSLLVVVALAIGILIGQGLGG